MNPFYGERFELVAHLYGGVYYLTPWDYMGSYKHGFVNCSVVHRGNGKIRGVCLHIKE